MCYRAGNSAPEMFDTLAELLTMLVAQSEQADMRSFYRTRCLPYT
jgi:hypothetical protein